MLSIFVFVSITVPLMCRLELNDSLHVSYTGVIGQEKYLAWVKLMKICPKRLILCRRSSNCDSCTWLGIASEHHSLLWSWKLFNKPIFHPIHNITLTDSVTHKKEPKVRSRELFLYVIGHSQHLFNMMVGYLSPKWCIFFNEPMLLNLT